MLQLKIEAVKRELPDTATFFFTEVSGKKPLYKAGQFITFVFDHHREEIRRSYSLSSSPDEELMSVTIKRITNGEISRFMLTKLNVSDILNAVEPAGRFTAEHFTTQKDIFFFAGGSGITPCFSQLKYILKRNGQSRLTLIYSNRTASILFREELDKLAQKHAGRFRVIYLVSSEGNRLNNELAEELVRENARFDLDKAEFYLCGPFDYMRMVRLTLLYIGIANKQVRKENFVIETVPVANGLVNYPPGKVKLRLNGEVYDIPVGENQSILQAVLQNKIQLPYSCRVGSCSTCAAICKSGKVVMSANEVLTDDDLDKGWILTCTGHPVSVDVVIEYSGAQGPA